MTPASGLITPHSHAVSFYEHDAEAVTALVRYVVGGLVYGERVIVIATAPHQAALDLVLREVHGFDPDTERAQGRYVTADAEEMLACFIIDGMPEITRFRESVGAVVAEACSGDAVVRAFGEMVAILWQQDNVSAAIELEELWNDLALEHDFHLLCAYPTGPLREAGLDEISRVCETHSSVRPPANYSLTVPSRLRPQTTDAEQSEVFLPVPEAAAAMRRFVGAILRAWGEDALMWDANLIASEMATNALSHGGSPFRASVSRTDGLIRLRVERIGTRRPVRRVSAEVASARGSAIVGKLAHAWGYDEQPDAVVTWADLLPSQGRSA